MLLDISCIQQPSCQIFPSFRNQAANLFLHSESNLLNLGTARSASVDVMSESFRLKMSNLRKKNIPGKR